MRDNIIKKRVRADEVVTKPASINRELQKLQNGSEQPPDDNIPDWNSNDLSGEFPSDSHICPSCFKTFDRKAVYTSHVQACSDAKCREKNKMKKRKAKEETKSKQLINFEENSNGSDQSVQQAVDPTPEGDVTVNKRKRKRTNKVKKEEVLEKHIVEQEESSSVDWNLDDEEEKKKLENIKKEIIEEDYRRVSISDISLNGRATTSTSIQFGAETNDEDDEPNALVIDEKVEEEPKSDQKCPQCDKVFDTDEKLKYHLNTYHSRQKRFKCKMCEYQGYRKKDTINHLNCVHNVDGDKEELEKYMESVMKAVDEESLAKQNELKKNQLKIKRKLARERLKLNGSKDEKAESEASEPTKVEVVPPPDVKIEFKEPAPVESPSKPSKVRRKSLHTSILVPQESDSTDDTKKIPKMFIKAKIEEAGNEKKKKRRRDRVGTSPQAGQSLLNISKFGKIVKRSSSGESKDGGRPIRNRIKPVRKDFLYDLSDLLKKDADAYREQAIQSTTVGFKRELRKRTMSTNTREIPDLSSFDDSSEAPTMLCPPRNPMKDDDDIPLMKFKDPRNRRMSVFAPPSRPMYPRSPVYKPPPEPTANHPNAGAAYKMAVREFNANRASLYEPKFLWSICFDQGNKKVSMPSFGSCNTSSISAAASILQKFSGKKLEAPFSGYSSNLSKSKSVEEKSKGTMSTDQLCTSFDMINVTSISENELDIPESRAINLNPGRSGLVALALEGAGNDVCVLQECSPESDDDDDDDDASSSSTEETKQPRHRKRSKKNSEKRKAGSRLTVMQRLQENKIRKSREQLFKRLIMDRQNDENPSPVYNLFSES